jgi:hypothetical protein
LSIAASASRPPCARASHARACAHRDTRASVVAQSKATARSLRMHAPPPARPAAAPTAPPPPTGAQQAPPSRKDRGAARRESRSAHRLPRQHCLLLHFFRARPPAAALCARVLLPACLPGVRS